MARPRPRDQLHPQMNPENAIGIDHNCHLRSGFVDAAANGVRPTIGMQKIEQAPATAYARLSRAALSGRLRFQIRAGIAARKAYRTAMFVGTATTKYGIAGQGQACDGREAVLGSCGNGFRWAPREGAGVDQLSVQSMRDRADRVMRDTSQLR